MRKYEVMYIIKPDLDLEVIKEIMEKFHNIITEKGGEINKHNEMGKRRLAYEINDYKEGYYDLVNFTSEPDVVEELERVFRITENVIRYLIIRDEK